MATLVLQAAGAAVGGLFGPVGAIFGRAAGALAGYAIDQSLFGETRRVEGRRLADLSVQASREGAPIPRVYGRVRLAGQMIWATRFEEVASTSEEGGKGGASATTVKSYSYFANFAIALCEGPIARLGRVWADGKPFDLGSVTHRIHRGGESQEPDSLIEAKQGSGKAPAYRGTAYVAFEHFPLEKFGNRVPFFSFEVIRPVGRLEKKIRAVTLIPGATEFGYSPTAINDVIAPGHKEPLNRHLEKDRTDWRVSLDELQALCPNLERVGLVASWFGDDLRANHCALRPGITERDIVTAPESWAVAGETRATAYRVSEHDGKPAYGGTPSDASVVRAIRDLNERGLNVTFYPFIMMDVPDGNELPDPYGGSEQGAYPWRGRITASIAPGLPGSPDKTGDAADQIDEFAGSASPGDFEIAGDNVIYTGPEEWSFRRLVLHYAHLCKAAGGVDAFLIGSELRGLTTLRSSATHYPFVQRLRDLAADVRDVLGGSTKISYAADWSEYFGHHPQDGSGDVFFHLDPLWGDANIDFVGIDNYMPLSDWRDGSNHLDAANWDSGRSLAYLRANIAGGEGFDWHYPTGADRDAQLRPAITDGAYGKPWVFRYKDLVGWWSNEHRNRPGGVEAAGSTAWAPQGKPIWLTELGCPAVDKGPNQPNVFPDPKSSESAFPYYSSGARDDLAQRRFLEAHLGYWDPDDPAFGINPVSAVYGGRMLRPGATHVWTWDARPFPAFPYRLDVWSDGENWETGHWLTGRLGATPARELVEKILDDYGASDVAVDELDGTVDGYVIGQVVSARQALEPLARLLMFEGYESGEVVRFVPRARPARQVFGEGDIAEEEGQALLAVRRAQETELPSEIGIGFADTLADFRESSVSSRRLVSGSVRSDASETGVAMSHAVASGLAEALLQDIWAGRETIGFALGNRALAVEPADICTLDAGGRSFAALITRIEDGAVRRIEARAIAPDLLKPTPGAPRVAPPVNVPVPSTPEVMLLDLPLLEGNEPPFAPRIAAFARPWPGAIAVALGTAASGYVARQILEQRATIGELTAPLGPGPVGRFDRANAVEVRLYGGALASVAGEALLNGANAAAIGSSASGFEVIQFETAAMLDATRWRLAGLLRGQAGTADRTAAGHASGARFVLLNDAVEPLTLSEAESGLALTVRCGPAGAIYDPDIFVDLPLAPARRGLMCLAPMHLRARRNAASGDVTILWMRQTRIGGDAWEPVEVPLGETSEAYTVEILDGAAVVRTLSATAPSVVYAAAARLADFGSLPTAITIRVRQLSPTEGPGLPTQRLLHV